jgi:transcriptional repressor NF-X1
MPCEHRIFITCDCQRVKQEARCGGTKNNPGNAIKSLKCDDECARLERNRKLALALNIDPETHKDDHIPYSAETLNMYLSNIPWTSEQEKTLRAFAADPDQKRYRFKPMKNPQRAFLHALAEDFGFDSESMDPEPYRHVAIFKTPRFVMAPMKTLAECARIRQVQRTQAVALASATVPEQKTKASNAVGELFNAFLIMKPRFGLTIEEVRAVITPSLLAASPPIQLDIAFLPNEEIVIHPPSVLRRPQQQTASWRPTTPNLKELADRLKALKPELAKDISATGLGQLRLCHVDGSLNILGREDDNTGGWSQVAAKAASGPRKVESTGLLKSQNGFAVLATTATKQKQKKEKVIVEEDWEAAEEREEERERKVGSGDEMGLVDGSGEVAG